MINDMAKKLILISLFYLVGQQLACQEAENWRASLQSELAEKLKEQMSLEDAIARQVSLVKFYEREFNTLHLLLQENKMKEKYYAGGFLWLLRNTLFIEPTGFREDYTAESNRLLSDINEECETNFLTREQLYLFRYYCKRYFITDMALKNLFAKMKVLAEEIREVSKKLDN